MGKRRQKPLLAETGILHLKSSFVHPSDESGLLNTVGGRQEQPLVLSSGNYGYGIPASLAAKNAEAAQAQADEEEADPDVQIVREINGGVYSAMELNKDRSGIEKDINAEEMSVAELVRSIGGARDAPLRRCDVVEDRSEITKESENNNGEAKEKDTEADEFYASLGINIPNENKSKESEEQKDPEIQSKEPGDNMTDSIADFYKSYTQYYYSQEPNPYGDQRLEFGLPIQMAEDSNINEGEQTIIQLARMAQIRARQATAAAEALAKAKKAKALDGGKGNKGEEEEDLFDPLPMEVVPSETAEELGITRDTTLEQYWEFIKEDPHDFNRWIYLIHYAESTNNITNCRRVYSAFLPLFSYCFGYWKRYSDLEKRFNYYGRALTILERGLEFIPLSTDLWLSYLNLFCEIYAHHPDYQDIVRVQYERSLNSCGMEFRSDALWEAYIQWEIDNKRLKRGFTLYGRVMQVPTRIYNRHWDNFQALVRDHHPRDFLEKDEYEYVRKKGCKKLGLKYKEEPEYEMGEIRKPSKPEDKLMDYVKSKILKKMTIVHVKCEVECEKRWVFEDRIKRPYFHTKALDKKQLRNWEEYLNFEISEGNHDRIVLLFERCLISCALYEEFWCKYARYLEDYHKKNPSSSQEVSVHFQKIQENMEIGSKKEMEEEENRIKDVQFLLNDVIEKIEEAEKLEKREMSNFVSSLINRIDREERIDKLEIASCLSSVISNVSSVEDDSTDISAGVHDNYIDLTDNSVLKVYNNESETLTKEIASPKLSGDSDSSGLPFKSGEQENNDNNDSSPGFTTLLSVPEFPHAKYAWQEAVRDVYKRACIVHCPKKYTIRLQWAAFEEELGNLEQARELILHVQLWFPTFLEAKVQMIELERRSENHQAVIALFDKYMPRLKSNSEYSMFAMKYARFLHKEMRKPDKALQILRKAIKRDRANPRLYSFVFEICYERYPSDKKGAFAALELALSCKDFSDEQKLIFLRKKLLFLQEHADIRRYRDSVEQLNKLQDVVRKREMEEYRRKEEEARLTVGIVNPDLTAFPVPDWSAVLHSGQNPVPIDFEEGGHAQQKTIHPVMGESAEMEVVSEESVAFKKVAPPSDLDLDNYGYSSKHPDYKMAEYMAQREYEQLEAKGRAEHLKDTDEDKASRKRKATEDVPGPLYIIQPKSATMYRSSVGAPIPSISSATGANDPQIIELEAPQQLSSVEVPSTSPCINVPEWFIKEGGELCLSETRAGFSVIRYWPHFLNDVGEKKMFKAVRRSVKWHQKQRVVWNKWRHVPRLVSWLGPCDWADRGLEMKKNEDWAPEILDLLHRINQITQHEFNSCFLNLYRTGHDSHPWHGDIHPAYGSNPPVATISLGALRLFEMRRRGPQHNFIRFPLFPGSLLIMEGACQEDWSHQIPKDPKVDGERISLVFRVMHAIEPIEENLPERPASNDPIESSREKVTKEPEKVVPVQKATTKKRTLAVIDKSNPNLIPVSNGSAGPSKSQDNEVEIIEVIEPPSQTRILFHNKK